MIFLRPWWLIALIVPFLLNGINKKSRGQNPWANIIDKKLLKALTIQTKTPFSKRTLSKLILILWGLMVVALAGPAWDKIPVPSAQVKPNTVIILDLNKDLTPKKLQQIHIKLYDLLTFLKEDRVGLVLFGQNQGYTAMPLTPDIQLISNLIPSLIPSVIPDDATNLKAGVQEAEKILNQTGNQGRILVISEKEAPKSIYPVLAFNPEKDSLTKLANELENSTSLNTTPVQDSNTADVWYDRGIWLALMALIPACLLFRKNVIFLWFIVGSICNAEAGWFQREDQEKYALNQQGIESYRHQNYQQAEEDFKKAHHPYNQGNALAYQGKIQEAIQAYQEALKLNPEDKDAKFNKEYLEKQLPKENQQSNQDKKEDKQDQQQQEISNNKRKIKGKINKSKRLILKATHKSNRNNKKINQNPSNPHRKKHKKN